MRKVLLASIKLDLRDRIFDTNPRPDTECDQPLQIGNTDDYERELGEELQNEPDLLPSRALPPMNATSDPGFEFPRLLEDDQTQGEKEEDIENGEQNGAQAQDDDGAQAQADDGAQVQDDDGAQVQEEDTTQAEDEDRTQAEDEDRTQAEDEDMENIAQIDETQDLDCM